jgi:hypothetical protein
VDETAFAAALIGAGDPGTAQQLPNDHLTTTVRWGVHA